MNWFSRDSSRRDSRGILRNRWEQEASEELRFHIEQQTNANTAAGLSPQEARRQAMLRFGAVEGVKEDCRQERPGHRFETIWADVRHGARILRKNPGFAAITILTLALGIGASTAVFTLADAVVLRPLPYQAPQQLVWMTEQAPSGEGTGVSWPNFQDWKRLNTVFTSVAGYRDARISLMGDSFPVPIAGRYVTAGYFDLAGIAPLIGRTFQPGENEVGGPDVAILSYEFWQQRYDGARSVLGKTIPLAGKAFTVVGVMPRGFGAVTRTDVWAPFEQNVPKPYLTGRDIAWLLYAVGRTKPGVTLEQARLEMNRVGDVLAHDFPAADAASRPVVNDLTRYMLGDNRAVLLLLAAAVGLLFFITCSNLANLLLVRTSSRQREFSVRLALGATTGKIVQQLFTEGMLLAFAGGLLGSLMAWAGVRLAAVLLPKNVPLAAPLHVDGRALVFILVLTIATALALGIAPGRFAMRASLQDVLRSSSYQVRGGHQRVHTALMICEVGLAMAVLVGTGLLARTMISLLRTDIGFNPANLLSATLTLVPSDYPNPAQAAQFMQRGIERIRQEPGVESAAAVFPVPFTPQVYQVLLAIEGRAPKPGVEQATYVSIVSSNYLSTMKIPILQGRDFVEQDTSREARVLVIDRALAQQYWPDENPVGQSVKLFTQDFADPQQKPFEIIGVAGPVHAENIDADPQPRVYVLMNHQPNYTMSFVIRTKIPPQLLAHDVQDAIHGLNRNASILSVGTMEKAIEGSQEPRRLAALLLPSFSIAALFLAAIGLYGVVSYLVAQRTNEIGVRMALGAQPRDVARLIFDYAGRLIFGGLALGLAAALAIAQLMRTLLFGVRWSDPLTFALATLVIVAVTLTACYLPARRAMRVDPIVALRYE
ncbi:MAG: ADOP family duplicated permease [Candidatus Acidiferrales bacterium]